MSWWDHFDIGIGVGFVIGAITCAIVMIMIP